MFRKADVQVKEIPSRKSYVTCGSLRCWLDQQRGSEKRGQHKQKRSCWRISNTLGLVSPCCCTCFHKHRFFATFFHLVTNQFISFYSKHLQSKLKILSPSFLFQHSFLWFPPFYHLSFFLLSPKERRMRQIMKLHNIEFNRGNKIWFHFNIKGSL